MAEKGDDGRHVVGRADYQQPVAVREHGFGIGYGDRSVGVQNAGDDEGPVDKLAQIADLLSVERLVGELHRHPFGHLVLVADGGQPLVLLLEVHAHHVADQQHREDDADHTQRVGDGVTQCDIGVVDAGSIGIGLLGGAQTRRVRHGTRQNADHRGDIDAGRQVKHIGRQHTQQHDGRGERHQRHAAVLERREETGTHLQADGEDEENQAELLDEVEHGRVDGHAEVAQGDAHEENPRDSQRHAAHLHLAQQQTARDSQCQRQDRVGDSLLTKKGL